MISPVLEVWFADILNVALTRGASDIHITPGLPPALRIDGNLSFLGGGTFEEPHVDTLAADLLGVGIRRRLEALEDVTGTWTRDDGTLLRVHAFRSAGGSSLAIRILRSAIPNLASLGLPDAVRRLAEKERGLVIFAGPTGSGKSTSLAAVIGHLNATSARRILTIEDPIEYRHRSDRSVVSQREIGREARSFSSALLSALRSDPDVIMVGEIRDRLTMEVAMTAAETGHLILTTLHTGSAVQTIDRILDAFAGEQQAQIRAQLSQAIEGVVCQRLLPRVNERGRCVAAEVLVANDAVRSIIRDGRSHQLRNILMTNRQSGMQTLEHALSQLIAAREISWASAAAVTERHSELAEVVG
jgi:twitching motility protein PilT